MFFFLLPPEPCWNSRLQSLTSFQDLTSPRGEKKKIQVSRTQVNMSSAGNLKHSGRFYTNFKVAWILCEFQANSDNIACSLQHSDYTFFIFTGQSQTHGKRSPAPQLFHFSKSLFALKTVGDCFQEVKAVAHTTLHRSTLHNPRWNCSLQVVTWATTFTLLPTLTQLFQKKKTKTKTHQTKTTPNNPNPPPKPKAHTNVFILLPRHIKLKKKYIKRAVHLFTDIYTLLLPWKPWQMLLN